MGGTPAKEEKTTTTQTQPWAPAQPLLGGILGQLQGQLGRTGLTGTESEALAALEARARAGNPWAPQVGKLAGDLLGGGPDRTGMISTNLEDYRTALQPTIRGDFLDPNKNPFFAGTTSGIADDVMNRVRSAYAAAGRAPEGAGSMPGQVGEAVTKAVSPLYADVWNRERANQLGAAGQLYGAGNTTGGLLSQLDQQALANRQAGVGVAKEAQAFESDPYNRLLAVEALRRSIPMDQLQRLVGMTVPIAGLGSSSSSTSVGTSTPAFNPFQTLLGAGLGIAGLLGGNPMAALGAMGSAAPMSLDPRMYGGSYPPSWSGGFGAGFVGNPAGRMPGLY